MNQQPKPKKSNVLQKLAATIVGDDKKPDWFFVTVQGIVVTVTRNFNLAYNEWREYAKPIDQECTLENRTFGCIASVEPDNDEKTPKLKLIDSSAHFLEGRPNTF